MMKSGLIVIYRDPLWLSLAALRIFLMLRLSHHLPDLAIALTAFLSLWRAWTLAHRPERTVQTHA